MSGRPRYPLMERVSQFRGSPESTTTTLWRYRASQIAAESPAGPPPTIATSYRDVMRDAGCKFDSPYGHREAAHQMLQTEFQLGRDHPTIGISGETSSDSQASSYSRPQLRFPGEKQLMTLMAALIESCNGAKHRVVRDANCAVLSHNVTDLTARLELPRVDSAAESALERRIHEQRDPSEFLSENRRDFVGPWAFGVSRTRVSELLRNPHLQGEAPLRGNDRCQAPAI